MSDQKIVKRVVDKMVWNLRERGLPLSDRDLAVMQESGFLRAPVRFVQIGEQLDAPGPPDFLASNQPVAIAPAWESKPATWPVPSSDVGDVACLAISQVANLLRSKRISPVELLRLEIERAERLGPQLNVYQLLFKDKALEAARVAEREIASGGYRGPLHGVPLAIKDLVDCAGVPTTAGSRALAGNIATRDATVVRRLREAGAVIIGKTHMPEFAYIAGSHNEFYGDTRNPWNQDYDSGGSSSGSAVAVAAGLAFGALGSDTGGSIRVPSAFCGIVGLKPTYGRVSLAGVYPLSWSLDHLGPMTRTVTDAAIMLDSLADYDVEDLRTRDVAVPRYADATVAVSKGQLKGMRFGLPRALLAHSSGIEPGVQASFAEMLRKLEARGAIVVEADAPHMDLLPTLYTAILQMEAAVGLGGMLRDHSGDLGQLTRLRILSGFAYGAGDYIRAQNIRASIRHECDHVWESVDFIVTPTMPTTATPLGKPGSTTFTGPFNALGWPTITLPCGMSANGLPVGFQIAARPWDEFRLLQIARAVELAGAYIADYPFEAHA